MLKKVLALAATALFSINASAGYVQYNFSGPVTGYFIQHDTDPSIAYFNFNVSIAGTPKPNGFSLNYQPQNSDGVTQLTNASTLFQNDGPTLFRIFSDFGGDQRSFINMGFKRTAQGGFEYSAEYSASILFGVQGGTAYLPFSGTDIGAVSIGTVNPDMARYLDERGGYAELVTPINPLVIGAQVPEPASLALFAIGAIGAAGVARRRKAA